MIDEGKLFDSESPVVDGRLSKWKRQEAEPSPSSIQAAGDAGSRKVHSSHPRAHHFLREEAWTNNIDGRLGSGLPCF